ncbi:acyl-CoA carboxylase epsilon subunit [Streptomyces sp. CB03238]|uniref:acyl-CoA carboxylase epsilon subunit n=1 Tax=Streptomyces sp. CB03238 TaxID=1907777 RepID=UPI000A10E3AF|nr:acyl-CoA carboxylase epsilon subunit [Streptomyces sp. CB03238]ORT56556.1 hypothetical protein BKD26_27470 [Streptomyces sp. CB03238]
MDEQTAFRVVRGQPDAEELAALTTVLLALLNRAGATEQQEAGAPAAYADWSVRGRARRPAVDWSGR